MEQNMFCPSIYSFLHQKVVTRTNTYACNAFYVPDTVYINASEIVSWYFTSLYDTYVVKKGTVSLSMDQILAHFTKDVFPLDVCCMCVYIDFNKQADIVFKVEYFTPY